MTKSRNCIALVAHDNRKAELVEARIAEGEIDFLIIFWDPLAPHPHDPDVKALLRIAVVWNIPFACNHATADFMIASPLMSDEYRRQPPSFDSYRQRLKT